MDVACLRPELDRRGVYPEAPSLLRAGHSVGDLSPAALELPSATVADDPLAPDGPAHGALLIADEPAMELTTASRLLELARAGLSLFFASATPTTVPGLKDHESRSEALRAVLEQLLAEPGLRQVGEAEPLDALQGAGIEPTVRYGEPADVGKVHRRHEGADFYDLYNNGGEPVTLSVELAGTCRPFDLDVWTGAIRPMAPFTPTEGGVRVGVSLVPGPARMVAVGDEVCPELAAGPPGSPGPTQARPRGRGRDRWPAAFPAECAMHGVQVGVSEDALGQQQAVLGPLVPGRQEDHRGVHRVLHQEVLCGPQEALVVIGCAVRDHVRPGAETSAVVPARRAVREAGHGELGQVALPLQKWEGP